MSMEMYTKFQLFSDQKLPVECSRIRSFPQIDVVFFLREVDGIVLSKPFEASRYFSYCNRVMLEIFCRADQY